MSKELAKTYDPKAIEEKLYERWCEFMDIKQLIGETTDYDKKLALEEKKPKSWCKSISAFANCFGGKLIFGVSNDSELVGLAGFRVAQRKL